MALLLLAWPLVLNLLTIIKPKSKYTFYSIMIGSTAAMALATFCYGPVSGSIRISNWIAFSLDNSSWIFVILIYLCWSMTLVYCMGYVAAHFSTKAEKKARFEAFYAAVRDFGTPLSFDNYAASFERNGTRFEINYPQDEHDTSLKINFFLPGQHFI